MFFSDNVGANCVDAFCQVLFLPKFILSYFRIVRMSKYEFVA